MNTFFGSSARSTVRTLVYGIGLACAASPSGLADVLPSFGDLSSVGVVADAGKSPECDRYLRWNMALNPDRYREACSVEELEPGDLERIQAAVRSERAVCGEAARYQVQQLQRQQRWDAQTQGASRARQPEVDAGVEWTFNLETGRQQLRLRTPVGSVRTTLDEGRRVEYGAAASPRRQPHAIVERAEAVRRALREAGKDLDLAVIGDQWTADNAVALAAYEGTKRLAREASRGASIWQEREQASYRDMSDCERYWDSVDAEVRAELGGRRR